MTEREELRKIGIVNTYDQLVCFGGDRIAITYSKADYGRGGRGPRFSVLRIVDGKKMVTDKDAAWYDYNRKTFNLFGPEKHHELKRRILAEAIAWCDKNYGKRDYVRNRMGDYVEREVNEKFPIRKMDRR